MDLGHSYGFKYIQYTEGCKRLVSCQNIKVYTLEGNLDVPLI